ncbi:MAG: FHIPEP family type III secretion protein [Treponema sp.]|jgi:flagellar biosynthesis protein FlhA|nr:FHIPEP family type III secretion protein [Treponema sp.]
MGDEFRRIFPCTGERDALNNKAETAALKLLLCLPADYVSPDFLHELLGAEFPLEGVLAGLCRKGLVVTDAETGSCLLPLALRPALSERYRPELKDAAPLMAYIAGRLSQAKEDSGLKDWLGLGRTVLDLFRNSRDPELAEFRHTVIKKLYETGAYDEARELLEIPEQAFETALPARRSPKDPSEEKAGFLVPYLSLCDALVVSPAGTAAGLHYDEENMFAPMLVILEQGLMARVLVRAAENLGVPVVGNGVLAENLAAYGKLGEAIPDLCFRAVAAVLSRVQGKRRPALRKTGKRKVSRPLKVELGETLMSFLGEKDREALGTEGPVLAEPLDRIRKRLRKLLGYSVPSIKVSLNKSLETDEYRICFKGIEARRGRLDLNWFDASGKGFGPEELKTAAKAGAEVIIRQVDALALNRAPDLLGRDEVQALLDKAEEKYPVVTGEIKGLLSLGSIRDILRGLVGEQVSIRHIQVILETLADWGGFGPAPNELIIEQIRSSLKRQICQEYADGRQVIRVLTLESKLEQRFADRGMFREGEEQISGNAWDEWVEAFSPAIRGMEEKGLPPVILCSPASRLLVKEFTRKQFPNLAVLSYVEIPSDINVEPVGEIRLEDGAL